MKLLRNCCYLYSKSATCFSNTLDLVRGPFRTYLLIAYAGTPRKVVSSPPSAIKGRRAIFESDESGKHADTHRIQAPNGEYTICVSS